MNDIVKYCIGGAIVLGIYKVMEIKTVSENIVTSLSNPRIHKIDMKGLAIRTEISVDNPTKGQIKISKPVVTLTTKGKYITSSHPENKQILIKKMTTTIIDTIEVVIPWTILIGYVAGLIGKIPQLVKAFENKDLTGIAKALEIPLEMKYSLYTNGLYYQSQPEKIL